MSSQESQVTLFLFLTKRMQHYIVREEFLTKMLFSMDLIFQL